MSGKARERGKGGSVQEQLTFSWRYLPLRLRSYSGPPEPGRWRSPALRPNGTTWGTPAELDSGNCLLTWTDKADHTAKFSKLWELLQGKKDALNIKECLCLYSVFVTSFIHSLVGTH